MMPWQLTNGATTQPHSGSTDGWPSGACVGSMVRIAGFGVSAGGMNGATPPRGSDDQVLQALQHEAQDDLVGEGAGQVELHLTSLP